MAKAHCTGLSIELLNFEEVGQCFRNCKKPSVTSSMARVPCVDAESLIVPKCSYHQSFERFREGLGVWAIPTSIWLAADASSLLAPRERHDKHC